MTDKSIPFRQWVSAVYSSRREAAVALGVTVTSVTRYMQGTRFPKRQVLAKIEELSGGMVTARSFSE